MIDRYIKGKATRISPEAPVPVIHAKRQKNVLGGAANVMNNLAALGIKTYAASISGKDDYKVLLQQLFREQHIETNGISFSDDRKSTVKTRVIADGQQICRIDDEDLIPITENEKTEICAYIESLCEQGLSGIIVEDYNKGCIEKSFVESIMQIAGHNKVPVALDPHPGNFFSVKGMHLMTPNRVEAFAMVGMYYTDAITPVENDTALMKVAEKIISKWEPKILMITLGAQGMAVFTKEGKFHWIPTVAREVFDVSGAGDTVISTCFASLIAGASVLDAATIANEAAGMVVAKVGTYAITLNELKKKLL